MGYYNQVIRRLRLSVSFIPYTNAKSHWEAISVLWHVSQTSWHISTKPVTWSGEYHFSPFRQDLKQVLWTFSRMRTFKGTHSTISSRRQWILSARFACQMNHWNCGRHTDNWTIADSFISVFPGGHSPASQRRNSGSIPDIHMRFVVYRMTPGQHFFMHFRSPLPQCSSERYSQRIVRLFFFFSCFADRASQYNIRN